MVMDRIDYRPITDFDKQFLGEDRALFGHSFLPNGWNFNMHILPDGFTRDSEGDRHFCDGTEQEMDGSPFSRSSNITTELFGTHWNNYDLQTVECADRV